MANVADPIFSFENMLPLLGLDQVSFKDHEKSPKTNPGQNEAFWSLEIMVPDNSC